MTNRIKWKMLSTEAIAPERGSEQAACWDLFALEDVEFGPGEIKVVKTGWACEVPDGYRTNIYVRSSTPLKKGFILANSIGIIDRDYRGDLGIQLMNVRTTPGLVQLRDPDSGLFYSDETAYLQKNRIKRGDKIAQIEVVTALGEEFGSSIVDELNQTKRGAGGFGSTGN